MYPKRFNRRGRSAPKAPTSARTSSQFVTCSGNSPTCLKGVGRTWNVAPPWPSVQAGSAPRTFLGAARAAFSAPAVGLPDEAQVRRVPGTLVQGTLPERLGIGPTEQDSSEGLQLLAAPAVEERVLLEGLWGERSCHGRVGGANDIPSRLLTRHRGRWNENRPPPRVRRGRHPAPSGPARQEEARYWTLPFVEPQASVFFETV